MLSNLTPAHALNKACELRDIAVFIVANPGNPDEVAMLQHLFHSINVFMPCRNSIHLLADSVDKWRGTAISDLRLHKISVPDGLKHMIGYIVQAWIMMWADVFVKESGARQVMFMDTDSVLAMPVTGAAIFDSFGKIYQLSWSSQWTRFVVPCRELLGTSCDRSYMTTFPFMMPVDAFSAMRKHIQSRFAKATSFDHAFAMWTRETKDYLKFGQFVTMGEYMRQFRANEVRQIFCPTVQEARAAPQSAALCRDYAALGVHLGWATCHFVGVAHGRNCELKWWTGNNMSRVKGRLKKYGPTYIQNIRQIINHGICFREFISGNVSKNCSSEMYRRPHFGVFMYTKAAFIESYLMPNMSNVYAMYSSVQLSRCPQSRCSP